MKQLKAKPIVVWDTEVEPGQHAIVRIPAPKLYDYTPVFLPVHVIHGKKPGPTLFITAAIHGDEINGTEIIRRFLKKRFLKLLSGTVIAIPVVNIYGFLFQERYLPDRRDLNRSFPGSGKGSLTSRFARLLGQIIVSQATHCIDLHTGSLRRTNFPQIRVDKKDNPEVMAMARAFGAPIILPSEPKEGSYRAFAKKNNIPYLLYEAGEASRFDEASIRIGVAGILGVMCHLKMLPKTVIKKNKNPCLIGRSSYWVRSPYGGLFIATKFLGNEVTKGDVLGIVMHPTDAEEQKITSPITGVIIGRSDAPLIHEGAALFHIACFEKEYSDRKKATWLKELNQLTNEEEGILEPQLDG